MREHERDTENVNEGDGVREIVTNNGKRPEAAASDQADDNNDWAKKALDDDTRSINSSEDKGEKVRCPEFNEKTGMSNPELCKGMKFLNGKVFGLP